MYEVVRVHLFVPLIVVESAQVILGELKMAVQEPKTR